jgi:hypothetical protein
MALDVDCGAIVVRFRSCRPRPDPKIPRAMCLSRGVVFASLGEDRTCQFQGNRSLIEALRSWYPLRQKGPKSARLSIPDGGTHGVPDPGVWFCLSEPCAAQLLSYR